jgi:Zn-dependent metalloprotease
MCKHHAEFNPAQCIIPPYINEKLSESSNRKVAEPALKSLVESLKLHARREFLATLPPSKIALLQPPSAKKKTTSVSMQVFDMENGTDPETATLVWNSAKPVDTGLDNTAKNVVAAGKATWNFYYEIFGRNSVDNLGLLLKHYIHYSTKYNNAMWDGSEMIYGDGDGTIFGDFTSDADVIGHELTHGVTQYESNLAYHNQSGALNESLSDVFGIIVKQRMFNQDAKQSDWLIGDNVLLGKAYALRSMKAPGTAYVNHPELGTDPQPATMDQFVQLPDTSRGDWGGVHYNSGIPNYAFYVAAFNIGGFAWEKTGRIWYNAMTDNSLKADATFADFKKLTIQHASTLYGKGSMEEKAIKDAWKTAKV